MPETLHVAVSRFTSQRGLQLVSIPHTWRNRQTYGRLLSKIGTIDDESTWKADPLETKPRNFLLGSKDDLEDYLSMDEEETTQTRMWLIAGTVKQITTAKRINKREKFSGPTVFILGAVTAHSKQNRSDETAVTLDSLCIFRHQLKLYMNGWAGTLHRDAPEEKMVAQMRIEISQALICKVISYFIEKKNANYFYNNLAFRLIFEDLGKDKRIKSKELMDRLDDLLEIGNQDLVDEYICSTEVTQPEFLPGGKVRLPMDSDICATGLNRKSYNGARLYQSYMQHQLGNSNKKPKKSRSRARLLDDIASEIVQEDDILSNSDSDSDSDSDSEIEIETEPMTLPIKKPDRSRSRSRSHMRDDIENDLIDDIKRRSRKRSKSRSRMKKEPIVWKTISPSEESESDSDSEPDEVRNQLMKKEVAEKLYLKIEQNLVEKLAEFVKDRFDMISY